MRLSQSGSVPSPTGGNGNRLGQRTRKKHKKLDAICEDVFTQNHRVKIESNEGTSEGMDKGNESELRRSLRARRAPVILDSSPPPPKKRRKVDELGKKVGRGSGEKVRGKGKLENEDVNEGANEGSENSEEELGAWRSRLRSRDNRISFKELNRSGSRLCRKRKLFKDIEEEDVERKSVKDELKDNVGALEGEKLRVVKSKRVGRGRVLIEHEDPLHEDHSEDEKSQNSIETLRNEDDGDGTLSTSGNDDENEEIVDGSIVPVVEKESEVPADILVEEKQNMDDNIEDIEQDVQLLSTFKLDEEVENQTHMVDGSTNDIVEDERGDDVREVSVGKTEIKLAECENDGKLEKCNVNEVGIPGPRIKEGRRCGLCGGGTDGKPPKRLANDSNGSDHETYSGSSASEEINYDAWDGFGDEPGWLGKLLGPINDRYGIAGIWVHQHCAVWSPEVYFAGLGCLKNVRAALCRGRALKCTRCGRPGATLGCRVDRCPRTYHLPCARASGCNFDHRKFLIACAYHRYLFQPHGEEYLQRIKKLKARKMKLELKKLSNDASRRDIEAEEKWMEKCGEDEEFLRREAKRLQRDLLRIAPVYIGGSHSEGENLLEGWESVAGLQDVIRCMKEVVIMPLLYPEFFDNMGITPPRGVLLHGYPGTGKTLVVRALIGSCARGDKRIAYFARKGADCLGKYVGDAERQLRLLFQVAERSQPSIIFFDEIDGLAPVRTRQQDQTHSSVVSTLLALMDGLKSRGSVIVIGATNRPDAVDPALRRPGRFDREIYFPLPSLKDRAAILSLHTRKWPKPVAGPLLEWVATKTVGFAGADLQALCAQVAVLALKRNCSWQQILSCNEGNFLEGKRPQLPTFSVEERDWLEALSLAPPPCSRREAGMATNEVQGSPLHLHLIPCLLQPLLCLILSLYLNDRIWLPHRLYYAGDSVKRTLVSVMEKKSMQVDRWWCLAPSMVQESDTARSIVRDLCIAGIVDGNAAFTGDYSANNGYFSESRSHPYNGDVNPPGFLKNLCYTQPKKVGYRILIAGDPRSGQKHLASCLIHCFMGSIEMQKIDLATISQEGQGNVEEGISRILLKCASMKLCAIFMPRIDLWAIQNVQKNSEASSHDGSCKEISSTLSQMGGEVCSSQPCQSDSADVAEPQAEVWNASQTWKSFIEQLECICVSSSLIILATSELPYAALPHEICQFFGSHSSKPEGSLISEHATPRFSVEVDGKFDQDFLIHSSASGLLREVIQQFVHLVHIGNHVQERSSIVSQPQSEAEKNTLSHGTDLKSIDEAGGANQLPEVSTTAISYLPGSRMGKEKSTLVLAISTFGNQILRYPHFSELCWVTSKLRDGPSADIRGPWKGWPFNSCIVRPCKSMPKETVAWNSSNSKGKDKFTLVRGLVAVGLSAYRGMYTSPTEVALEVRKVLHLLAMQISARIQSGKDRYQFIRLLSQVAYLEDMVDNWAHLLRSLEPDSQARSLNPKLSGAESLESLQTPAGKVLQLEEQPSIQDGSLQELELVKDGVHGSVVEGSGPVDLNPKAGDVGGDNANDPTDLDLNSPKKMVSSSHIAPYICVSGFANPMSTTDFEDSPVVDQSDPPMVAEQMQSTQLSIPAVGANSHDQLNAGNGVETEVPAEPLKHRGDSDSPMPDLNLPSGTSDLSSESKAVCSYSSCNGCTYTLYQLLKKIVSRDRELSGSCNTLEDAHDLVSSLSTSLCSIIRNLLANQQRSKANRKLLESQKMNACQCSRSENERTMIKECACHTGNGMSKEVNTLLYDQPGFTPTYMFRDGVLISADSVEEFSLHCKYDKLCLCSLIESIVINKQPLE